MQQPLESGASKKASGHGPQPKPVVLADTDLLVTIFSGKPQIPQIRTHKIMTQNHPPRSSHTNLEDLELTRLQDLQVPKIHQGKYCMCSHLPFLARRAGDHFMTHLLPLGCQV